MTHRLHRFPALPPRAAFIGLLAFGGTLVNAQNVPASSSANPRQEEIIELSPFVTTASSDKGYVATSSLAGSRVNTPLKDIAAQIDVMTPEFLSDIGATTMDEAIVYSTNNGTPNEQNVGPNDGTNSTRVTGRARGFDSVTASVDFYQTNMPSELYNIERLTIANGPQSILFGVGTAGGAVDVSTKRAQMRDRYEFSLRTDNNDSLRSTFDINKELVPKKLALRLVGLKSNINQFVDGAYNDQNRLFGALTLKAARNTTVHISGERMTQQASYYTNYLAQDFVTPWVDAGRPLFDNSKGNGAIPAAGGPVYGRNSNALRVIAYDGSDVVTTYQWNGSALTRGPHQLAGVIDTRAGSLYNDTIYPHLSDPRVSGRVNRLDGKVLRASIEQKISGDFYAELGFNYERVHEFRGGPFYEAESINLFADPNMYLPGGTTAAPQTALNPHAGDLYIETFPNGQEVLDMTREARLTLSYEFDFAKHTNGLARMLGRHRLVGLVSTRTDENRSQVSRGSIIGNTSFTTGDLLNNSRLLRTRYYLDPANGNVTAGVYPGGGGFFGPWTFTDSKTGETFQASMFDDPAGRTSSTVGSKKNIQTYMLALQSYFWRDRINLFAGRRLDTFKSYLIDPTALERGDQLASGDKKGLYTPLMDAGFDPTASLDASGKTYSYGAVMQATHWLSLSASKSNNTALPQSFLDTNNQVLPGVHSDGYDYGFRVSLIDDAISLRVNFYREDQHALVGSGQTVRTASALIEERLRGSSRPAGIADVAADGYDPVGRGVNAYRSIEDKIARGIDLTLVARITNNWDARLAFGKQNTHVYKKSEDFNVWAEHRLPVWQDFGGLGWDTVSISDTDPRTVHQYYDQEVLLEINHWRTVEGLQRFRQREWRGSLFTNYRFTSGWLKGLNIGGGGRYLSPMMISFYAKPAPTSSNPDGVVEDITRPIYSKASVAVDLVAGYGRKTKIFGGHKIDWRVQLNVRNLLEPDTIEAARSKLDYSGDVLHYNFVEPRQISLTTTFTF